MGWVKAERVMISGAGMEIKCPGCGYYSNTLNALHTCAECGAPWRSKGITFSFLIKENRRSSNG